MVSAEVPVSSTFRAATDRWGAVILIVGLLLVATLFLLMLPPRT